MWCLTPCQLAAVLLRVRTEIESPAVREQRVSMLSGTPDSRAPAPSAHAKRLSVTTPHRGRR